MKNELYLYRYIYICSMCVWTHMNILFNGEDNPFQSEFLTQLDHAEKVHCLQLVRHGTTVFESTGIVQRYWDNESERDDEMRLDMQTTTMNIWRRRKQVMFECTTFPAALAVQHKVSLHLGDIQEVVFCKSFPPTPREIVLRFPTGMLFPGGANAWSPRIQPTGRLNETVRLDDGGSLLLPPLLFATWVYHLLWSLAHHRRRSEQCGDLLCAWRR